MCVRSGLGKRHTGFTLIEVLVAASIVSVAVLGLLASFSLCVRASSRVSGLDGAVDLAERKLQTALAGPGGMPGALHGTTERYRWTVRFSEKTDQLTLASVEIEWLEGGRSRTYRLGQLFHPAE